MANYDLYTELQLDKDMPPYEMAEVLGSRAADLRNQGYSDDSPELDQVETARAILGDPYKRDTYEAALYGPEDDVVNIRWLHDLADSRTPGPLGARPGVMGGSPSFEASPSSATPDAEGGLEQPEPAGPSADVTRAQRVDDTYASSDDLEATRVNAAVPEVGLPYSVSPGDQTPGELTSGDHLTYGDVASGGPGEPDRVVPDAGAGADPTTGDGSVHQAPTQNAWQQPTQFSQPQHQQQGPRQEGPSAQLDMSTWGVGGRSRSESKVYLAILAVIVVGMIYPLIVLLTADPNDMGSGLSVLKATLFTLAHVAAWVSINEIVWGVRKIVAPDKPTEK
ncbi:hypothetical protein PQI66_07560 [Corynebacterium sp. USCH3]|uniref:hypothetical protein n=1 Tax=Corynebacterium sp. USCH3 TaxID=3024840 RepID=UPI0030B59568